MIRLKAPAAALLALAAGPAAADSQSSDSASDCANGRCTRVERHVIERDGLRYERRRVEGWREPWLLGRERFLPPWRLPPRPRRNRDDDDD